MCIYIHIATSPSDISIDIRCFIDQVHLSSAPPTLKRFAVCCCVLQDCSVCCSILRVCCNMLQCVEVWCCVMQCVASLSQCAASMLKCVAVCSAVGDDPSRPLQCAHVYVCVHSSLSICTKVVLFLVEVILSATTEGCSHTWPHHKLPGGVISTP